MKFVVRKTTIVNYEVEAADSEKALEIAQSGKKLKVLRTTAAFDAVPQQESAKSPPAQIRIPAQAPPA